MKRLILLIMILIPVMVAFIRCCYEEPNRKIGNIYNYDFKNNIKIDSLNEAIQYVINNVSYLPEKQEYWQTPEETYNLKTGDCEDQAILLMYILNKLQIKTEFIAAKLSKKSAHSFIYIYDNDIFINPQTGTIFNSNDFLDNYSIIESYTYSEVLWITIKYHRGIKR